MKRSIQRIEEHIKYILIKNFREIPEDNEQEQTLVQKKQWKIFENKNMIIKIL